ncbi:MAG TPA: putative phage tail protein [Ruminiclostridium sp.]|nr:putative phage tail protein [Ruminiclostridium sp.]
MSLIDLMPGYYKKSPEVAGLQAAFENWTEALKAAKADLFLQFNISSSTALGLMLWENALGLETDVTKSFEYRRSRVMSKLRGAGTTTKQMLKNVAESFSNGEVEIIEHNGESRFVVKFVGTLGVTPNINDLKAAIEEIKPAHLGFVFEYRYITWNDFEKYNHSWDEWNSMNLSWDKFETYREVA